MFSKAQSIYFKILARLTDQFFFLLAQMVIFNYCTSENYSLENIHFKYFYTPTLCIQSRGNIKILICLRCTNKLIQEFLISGIHLLKYLWNLISKEMSGYNKEWTKIIVNLEAEKHPWRMQLNVANLKLIGLTIAYMKKSVVWLV